MLCLFSAKGGVGCSVAAAATAGISSRRAPTLLVDLHGELSSILGLEPAADGLSGWFQTEAAAPDLLRRLEVPVTDRLSLLPNGGRRSLGAPDRYQLLADLLRVEQRQVVVDVGTLGLSAVPLVAQASRSVLVTRACYLALRAAQSGPSPDHVLLVREAGRALNANDVAVAIGAPVAAVVPWDPAVARAVDAGVLLRRLPRSLNSLEAVL